MGTITKALEILNLFSRTRPEFGLGDVVRLTGRDKATAHRYLVELTQNGFLEQNPVTRAYRLGPAILRLSAVREATYPVRAVLRPVVNALAEEVGELAHTSLLDGDMLSTVYYFDPRLHGTQVAFDAAERLPLHATSSGLAVLAFGPDGLLKRVMDGPIGSFTDVTPTDPDRLREMIAEVRRTGSSRMSGAFDAEVKSQGAPVFGPEGHAVGAISVAIPRVRATEEKLDTVRDALFEAVRAASHSLGGQLPAGFPIAAT